MPIEMGHKLVERESADGFHAGNGVAQTGQQAEDPLLAALCHWRLGSVLFALGEYTAARAHFEEMISFYEPQHHRALVSLGGADAGLSALTYDACCLWCLGYPEQAEKRAKEALALARELDHPFTQADVLSFVGCMLNEMHRDPQALKDNAEELVRLANEKSMPTWLAFGIWHRGNALVTLGQVQEG
jgi:tetratricopeptide (TPR) repeat protein